MTIISHNRYSSSWPIIKRHFKTALPHLNLKKTVNVLLSRLEKAAGAEVLRSKPYFIKIEPTNLCNLKCRGCLHAAENNALSGSGKTGSIDIGLFKKVVNELKQYLVKVSLYSMGEPLIYPRIAEIVKILSDNNIGSVISSNLNILSPELARGLVKNRLSHLIVAMDGCDDESYAEYRQGGDFGKVMENLKILIAEKKRQNSKYPLIEIQTIAPEKNDRKKIEKIMAIAEKLGIDYFSVKKDLREEYGNPQPKQKTCFWLYGHPQIKFDGTVQPCCFYYNDELNNFGSVNDGNMEEIWNNEKFRAARKYFKDGKKSDPYLSCHKCIFFKPKK